MADYIADVLNQTSKLDWAMPFQRTGAFPIDRSTLFSSYEDAVAYARGDGTDERGLGGASYVGQIISVYEAATEEAAACINAYIITPDKALSKLAATAASGDIEADLLLFHALVTYTRTCFRIPSAVTCQRIKKTFFCAAISLHAHAKRAVKRTIETPKGFRFAKI